MTFAVAPPESWKSVSSDLLARIKNLVAPAPTADPGDTTADVVLRPYSFQSECECPYVCHRDHENE